MMYPNDSQIDERLTKLLSHTAPDYTLLHYTASPTHDHMRLIVCAANDNQRLTFVVNMWSGYATQEGFIGVFSDAPNDAHAQTDYEFGIARPVQMLMRVHPNAHIQFVDNEEDGDDALFGYVAYDDNYKPLAWAPVPLDDDDDEGPVVDAPARVTHTIPEGLDDQMEYIRGVDGNDPDNIA